MKITIRDIAKKCGVSTSTVSGVLHNRDYVKKETRDRILKTIQKLNYDPLSNIPLARRSRSGRIGLIVPFKEAGTAAFYQRAVLALQGAASERGWECVIYSQDDVKRKTTVSCHLGRANFDCDALVVYCPIDDSWQEWMRVLHGWDIPLALIRRRTESLPGIIQLHNDDEAGLRLALDHLYERGHTRIAILGSYRTHPFITRHAVTYRAFMAEKGLPVHQEWQGGIFNQEATAPGSREIVAEWWQSLVRDGLTPTACVCRNDPLALRLVLRLERLGVRVPEDLSVIGYDDDFGDDGMPLPLSTVRIPVEEMVVVAVNMLSDKMQGLNTGSAVVDMPLELRIRESSD